MIKRRGPCGRRNTQIFASAFAVARLLEGLGREAEILNQTSVIANLLFGYRELQFPIQHIPRLPLPVLRRQSACRLGLKVHPAPRAGVQDRAAQQGCGHVVYDDAEATG